MGQDPYLLAWFDQVDIDWLLATSKQETIPAGTYILKEGTPSASLFIITEGSFGIETTNNNPAITLGPGEILGEMSFVDNSLPAASVRANEVSVVLDLEKTVLDEKLRQDKAFAARFFRAISAVLANRLRATLNSSPTPTN